VYNIIYYKKTIIGYVLLLIIMYVHKIIYKAWERGIRWTQRERDRRDCGKAWVWDVGCRTIDRVLNRNLI